jgi:hypothetical protein
LWRKITTEKHSKWERCWFHTLKWISCIKEGLTDILNTLYIKIVAKIFRCKDKPIWELKEIELHNMNREDMLSECKTMLCTP